PSAPQVFDTDKRVTLIFRTASLPAEATVTGASLRLVASDMLEKSDVTIIAYLLPVEEQAFGTVFIGDKEPGLNGDKRWEANSPDLLARIRGGPQTTITLALEPAGADAGKRTRRWYSPGATEKADRPRLTLEYTLPGWTEPTETIGLRGVQSS